MTREEFIGKLSNYFTIDQIDHLEDSGYECAVDAHDGMEIEEDDLWYLGREFVCTQLWDISDDPDEINAMLGDAGPMDGQCYIDMLTAMDAYGHDW